MHDFRVLGEITNCVVSAPYPDVPRMSPRMYPFGRSGKALRPIACPLLCTLALAI
jgi:hypothetical protein